MKSHVVKQFKCSIKSNTKFGTNSTVTVKSRYIESDQSTSSLFEYLHLPSIIKFDKSLAAWEGGEMLTFTPNIVLKKPDKKPRSLTYAFLLESESVKKTEKYPRRLLIVALIKSSTWNSFELKYINTTHWNYEF